ncbi:MAG: GGDEF domain-containing protein, partial [Lachnospiraceae bacterium]|nr:GGDEF domain-containing protein [Lachnospiraceae bacterium]
IGIVCQTTPGILMMIDLDSFKPVNDIYGHEMGDRILIRFAEIIKSAVRGTDLVGRMGGDEFIAYCQNVRSEQVIAKKTKYINEELLISAREYMGEDLSIPLGASIGCVIAPDEGINFTDLYKKADRALYEVKENGKHGYSFYHDDSSKKKIGERPSTDLSNLIKVLEERSPANGAFSVPFPQFQVIYQFLTRVRNIAQHDVWILLFNVSELAPVDKEVHEKAIDTFFSALHNSLRASDVVTQNNKSQFLILLFDTELHNIELILDRIMKKWSASEGNDLFEVSYELDNVK